MIARCFLATRLVVMASVLLVTGIAAVAGELGTAIRNNDLKRAKEFLAQYPNAKGRADVMALHQAARFGEPEMVELLLKHGANPNVRNNSYPGTPLHFTDDPEIARLLLEYGADINAKDSSDRTPIQAAAQDENHDLVEFLLKAGQVLDIESLAHLGRTKEIVDLLKKNPELAKPPLRSLEIAIRKRNLELVRLLLEHGADPNHKRKATNISGISGRYMLLSAAINFGTYEIAELLLKHGARVDVTAFVGKSEVDALSYTIAHKELRFAKLLLDHGADPKPKKSEWGDYSESDSAMHCAARVGDVAKAELLMEFGGSVNAEIRNGVTPLFIAATDGHRRFCDFLLEHGARLDFYSACALGKDDDVSRMLVSDPDLAKSHDKYFGRLGLYYAVHAGNTKLVERLIANGADVNATKVADVKVMPARGDSVLHEAARRGDAAMAKVLLDHGAAVNAINKYGETPRLLAASGRHEAVVRLLLDRGAKTELNPKRDQEAKADVYSACVLGLKDEVTKFLAADPKLVNAPAGRYRQQLITIAAINGHVAIVELLLSKGAEIRPTYDQAPLNAASAHGHLAVVQLLVKKGVDVNEKDERGDLPLSDAASGGHAEVVQFLLDQKANALAMDYQRDTALHRAAHRGSIASAELLLRAGVPINQKNRSGETPLHKSVANAHVEMSAWLIQKGADVNALTRRRESPLRYAERPQWFDEPRDDKEKADRQRVAELLSKHGGTR